MRKYVLGAAVLVVLVALGILLWPKGSEAVRTAGNTPSYAVELTVDPRPGPVTAIVRVSRHDRGLPAVDEVVIDAVMPRMGHAMPQIVATRREDHFEARGELFTMGGLWEVSLRLADETVTVQVTVTG